MLAEEEEEEDRVYTAHTQSGALDMDTNSQEIAWEF